MSRMIAVLVLCSLAVFLFGCGSQPQGQPMTAEELKAKGLPGADGGIVPEGQGAPDASVATGGAPAGAPGGEVIETIGDPAPAPGAPPAPPAPDAGAPAGGS